MLRAFLRMLGYLKVDYGFSCGRHWIEIDGKVIARTDDADLRMSDEDVRRIGYAILDRGRHWTPPVPDKKGGPT